MQTHDLASDFTRLRVMRTIPRKDDVCYCVPIFCFAPIHDDVPGHKLLYGSRGTRMKTVNRPQRPSFCASHATRRQYSEMIFFSHTPIPVETLNRTVTVNPSRNMDV